MDVTTIKTTLIKVEKIECNEGQIPDVPSNPRKISEERLEALKRSVSELPTMLWLRELLVYRQDDKYIVLGGNQRLVVCRELGFDEVPCKIIPQDTAKEELCRIVALDNEEFGKTDWEKVQAEWNVEELKEWGIDVSFISFGDDVNIDDLFEEQGRQAKEETLKITVTIPEMLKEQFDESAVTEYGGVSVS